MAREIQRRRLSLPTAAKTPRPDYRFRGSNAEALKLRQEFVLSGGSETGKTIACLTRLDRLARSYPGSQLAIVRKVQSDLEATVLLTYRKKILGENSDVRPYGGDKAEWFDYPNGSRVWCGGLDKAGKVLSSERDFVYVNQTEELLLNDWETVTTRTTGRAGNAPFSFTFGDCNPRGSKHWILERAKAGALKLLVSYHVDNPSLYDDNGNITEQGQRTLAKLAALTGLREKRLHRGLWVQAEGVVYDGWEPNIHVTVRAPEEFPIVAMCVDDGFTSPAAILWVGIDPDGRLHVFSEWYETHKVHTEIAAAALEVRLGRAPMVVVGDSAAAALIASMQKTGLPAIGHKGLVKDGIDLVTDLLKVQGDGKPRLTVDPGCTNFVNEIESYVWSDSGKEAPAGGQADHTQDCLRYLVHYLYGLKDTAQVRVVDAGDEYEFYRN